MTDTRGLIISRACFVYDSHPLGKHDKLYDKFEEFKQQGISRNEAIELVLKDHSKYSVEIDDAASADKRWDDAISEVDRELGERWLKRKPGE